MPAWPLFKSAQAVPFPSSLYPTLISLLFRSSGCPNNPATLGTRGYIPDISPRGYVGLGESCIVLPKIGIVELVLKI